MINFTRLFKQYHSLKNLYHKAVAFYNNELHAYFFVDDDAKVISKATGIPEERDGLLIIADDFDLNSMGVPYVATLCPMGR